jgi:tetratricopeptide (TPR) repeat protein
MVIAEADSLLGNEKRITRDTTALNFAIETLNGPLGYLFAKQELAKAYYFMGRNFYYLNDFAKAADYYILCDRLNPTYPLYKGRINSCMGYLCKQDSCFEEALEFYERSSYAFKEAGDEWYYAHNLLNVAECHISLHKYYEADSLLTIAETFDIDSAYYARMVETRGLYFYERQEYDSALTYFVCIENYPRPIEAKCYSYMKMMQIYIRQNNYDVAIDFAKLIITNSLNPVYRTNAYYSLIKHMEAQNNIQELALYSHLRKDEDRRVQYYSVLYAEASSKLKAYLENPYPYLLINWCIFGGIIVILLLCIITYALYKHKQCASYKTAEILRLQEEKNLAARALFERQIFDCSVRFTSIDTWKDSHKLREQANIYCGNIFYRLEETYHLSEQEIKICLMVLLDFSREQMANYLYVQPNTISKAKNKIAKQLGTSSAQLREFLITFLA